MKLKLFITLAMVLLISACTATLQIQISFDSNGGTAVESIDFSTNETFSLPDNPTKAGFVFAGWYFDDETFEVPFSINTFLNNPISNSITLYAKWSEDANVQIGMNRVVFISDGVVEKTSYFQQGYTISLPGITKTGHTLEGWYISYNDGQTLDEKWDFTSDELTKDTVLYANWIVNTYTLTIENLEGPNEVIEYDYAEPIEISNPSKTGYNFSGWSYSDGDVPLTMPDKDIIISANWQIKTYEVTYYDASTLMMIGDYVLDFGDSIKLIEANYDDVIIVTKMDKIYFNHEPVFEDFVLPTGEFIVDVTIGYLFYGILTNVGNVYTWGSDGSGRLGNGEIESDKDFPFEITNNFSTLDGKIIDIEFGYNHAIALSNTGEVFTWGSDSNGALGNDTNNGSKSSPYEISGKFNLIEGDYIIQIEVGSYISAALSIEGELFMWGDRYYGQLADEYGDYYSTSSSTDDFSDAQNPVNMTYTISSEYGKIIYININNSNSALITELGNVFVFGINTYGQLGIAGISNTYRRGDSSYFYDDDYIVVPKVINGQFNLFDNEKISMINIENGIMTALSNLGRVFTSGKGDLSQLGDASISSSVAPMDISRFIPLSVDEKVIYTQSTKSTTYFFTDLGRIFYTSQGEYPKLLTNQVNAFDEINSIIVSHFDTNSYVPTKEGYAFDGWYYDSSYNLPIENDSFVEATELYAKWTPLKVTITFQTNGGTNLESITEDANNFINVYETTKEGYTFDGFYTDESFSNLFDNVMQTSDFTVYAKWIANDYTATYIDYDSDISTAGLILDVGEEVIEIATGDYHTILLTSNNRVFSVGYNAYGQLGNGDNIEQNTFVEITSSLNLNADETIIQISAGAYFSGLLTSEGRVFMWGSNQNGQLGDGSNTNSYVPIDITNNFNLEAGEKIESLALGMSHTGVLTNQDRIFMWGRNSAYQLGTGGYSDSKLPLDISNNFSLNTDEKIVELTLNEENTGFITNTGRVFHWGQGNNYSNGDNSTSDNRTPLDISSFFNLSTEEKIIKLNLGGSSSETSFAISNLGNVYSWGQSANYQTGDGSTYDNRVPTKINTYFSLLQGEEIIEAYSNYRFSYILTSYGRVYMFGNGSYIDSSLGLNFGSGTYLINDQLNLYPFEYIKDVYLGREFIYFMTSDNRLLSLGRNENGELGNSLSSTDQIIHSILAKKYNSQTLTVEDAYNFTLTKESFTFGGLFSDPELTIPLTTVVVDDIYVYVKWIPDNITISFDTGDATPIDDISQTFGSLITKPADPELEGYTFVGWSPELPNFMPNEDTLYTAQWQINQYNIVIYDWDGSEIETLSVDYKKDLNTLTLPVPVRDGYDFIGWDKELVSRMPAEDITLTATYAYYERQQEGINTSINNLYGSEVLNNGDYFIVSAPQYNTNQGSVFVYKYSSRTYERQIVGSTAVSQDYFGNTIATGGNYLAVGAYGNPSFSTIQGKVYVYKLDDPTYERIITNSDFIAGDMFGLDIVIAGDYIIVTAKQFDNNKGQVYVYKFSDESYERIIKETTATNNHQFGYDIDVSNDYLAISAKGYNNNLGKVFIYKLSDETYKDEITNSATTANASFGEKVIIEGLYLIVTSPNTNSGQGVVVIYDLPSGDYLRTVSATNSTTSSYFGFNVVTEGDYFVVSSKVNTSNEASAYVYKFSDSSYIREITSTTTLFAEEISIQGDYLLVSSENQDNKKGTVYLYKFSDETYIRTIVGSDSLSLDYFGSEITLNDQYILVGAKNYDSNKGLVYIYKI